VNSAPYPNSDTVSVINTATNAVTETVAIAGDSSVVAGIAVNPAGTDLYVTNYSSGTVSVINPAISAVTATVGVGGKPTGIAVNPAGTYVYVTNYSSGTVSVINTATNRVAATVNVGQGPSGIAVNSAGTYAYIANALSGTLSVINTATNAVTATVALGNNPVGLAVTPAGTSVYVTSYNPGSNTGNRTVSVIDTATNTVTATVPVGPMPYTGFGYPWGIAVNPAGTDVYVAIEGTYSVYVIDTATNTVTATVALPPNIGGGVGIIPFTGNFVGGPTIPPSINPGGIVNSASFAANAPVAPGSLATVFGIFSTIPAQASSVPWPTTLSGLSIQFNSIQAPLYFASQGQANVQVPWELAGLTQSSVSASVGGDTSAAQQVNFASTAPGIFAMNAQGQGAVVDAQSGRLVSQISPAKAGNTYISIYCTGLGPVSNQPATGTGASSTVLSPTILQPTVTIGNVSVAGAGILFSGLAPSLIGVYQINVQVPAGVPGGNAVPLVVSIGGATSNTVTIAVQ
jgi:uncharacterized protein (TIGR03437 family)